MLDGFHDNKKGTAPTISALLLMAITVGCMVLVIGSGENIIRLQSAQMGGTTVCGKRLLHRRSY